MQLWVYICTCIFNVDACSAELSADEFYSKFFSLVCLFGTLQWHVPLIRDIVIVIMLSCLILFISVHIFPCSMGTDH